MTGPDRRHVGIDAGQSAIRALVDGEREPRTTGGLSHPASVEEFTDRVAALVDPGRTMGVGRVVIGMTTLPASAAARQDLASRLSARLDADEVWVTGDEVTAHAGAFAGGAGVVLVVGTGVACLASDPPTGRRRSFDGAGHLLGDEGGAFWIGRHAIRAALAATDGRGPATVLVDAITERFGDLDSLAPRLHAAPDAVDRIARATLDAFAAAADGDDVAQRLLDDAADRLASTTAAAVRWLGGDEGGDVGVDEGADVGGGEGVSVALDGRLLDEVDALAARLVVRLTERFGPELALAHRPGSGLAGALELARHPVEQSPYRRWLDTAPATTRRDGAERILRAASGVVTAIAATEIPAIERAALHLADTIADGGLVHVFGTGHSHLLAEELFYRAGGLAAIDPILVPSLMLHESAVRSTGLERTPGLADDVLREVEMSATDTLIVVSNSGGNTVTQEVAERCRNAGMAVVAIVSRRHAATKPGARLVELADVVLDNHGVVGDAAVRLAGIDTPVGPTSTIAGAAIVHALAAATIEELRDRGVEPTVLRSANTSGGDAHNARVLAELAGRIRSL